MACRNAVTPAHSVAGDEYVHTPFVRKWKPSIRGTGPAAVEYFHDFLLTGSLRPRGGVIVANHEMSAVGKDHTLLLATTREREHHNHGNLFRR